MIAAIQTSRSLPPSNGTVADCFTVPSSHYGSIMTATPIASADIPASTTTKSTAGETYARSAVADGFGSIAAALSVVISHVLFT